LKKLLILGGSGFVGSSIVDYGIDKKLIDKIFYPLVSGKESGSGLGLSLAQNFITQHNGMIDCFSTPGETKFSIILPIQNNLKINEVVK
jgi:two-component system nitrogen regulation sensor histidine kinase GlnL